MATERTRRVGQLLKEEIAGMLTRGLKDDLPAFTTVTDVRVTVDLRLARVAVSVYGSDDERQATLEILADQAPRIRKEIGRRVRLKYTPELVFELDESLEKVERLEELFDEIHRNDADDAALPPETE